MTFITDYLETIDYIALAALVIFAVLAFYRRENVWMGLLVFVVVFWAASRSGLL